MGICSRLQLSYLLADIVTMHIGLVPNLDTLYYIQSPLYFCLVSLMDPLVLCLETVTVLLVTSYKTKTKLLTTNVGAGWWW